MFLQKKKKKANLLKFLWKRKEVMNECVWHVIVVHSQWSICLRVYSYFVLGKCGVVGSIIGCSLASAVSSSFPKLFARLLLMPLAPLQSWKVPWIIVLHIAFSRWRIENFTKHMAVCSIGRELTEPSYILNTYEGAHLLCSPYESHC